MVTDLNNDDQPADEPLADVGSSQTDEASSQDDGLSALYQALSKGQDDTPAEEPAEADASDESGAAKPEKDDQSAPEDDDPAADEQPAFDRPRAWAADKDEVWQSLSPEAKDYVAKREEEAQRQIGTLSRKAEKASPLLDVTEKYASVIPEGWTTEDAVESMLAVQALLVENPKAGIRYIADTFKVDLRNLEFSEDGKLEQLESENAAARATQRIQSGREQAAQSNHLHDVIADWSDGKEHFDAVQDEMAMIINAMPNVSDPQAALDQAYEKACRLNDDVWSKVQAKAEAEAEKARQKAERSKRHAQEAARSGQMTAGQRSLGAAGGKPFDIDDDEAMSSLYREIVNRG